MRRGNDAGEYLRLADRVREQAGREPIAGVAQRAGVSVSTSEKMRWLARAYSLSDREAIGAGALSELTPSHLEVAAQAGPARVALLRRAAEEHMPVRQMRLLAEQATGVAAGPVVVTGGASDLASAGSSLARYATLPDPALDRLLTGPNGHLIRQLIAAGSQLAARLDTTVGAK
jgi:hypothetical protein